MLWSISRVFKPNMTGARDAHAEAHIEYLKSQKHILVLSGAQFNDEGTERTGSLLILHVNTRAEAEAFLAGDPFMKAGMFHNISINRMQKGQWNPDAATGA